MTEAVTGEILLKDLIARLDADYGAEKSGGRDDPAGDKPLGELFLIFFWDLCYESGAFTEETPMTAQMLAHCVADASKKLYRGDTVLSGVRLRAAQAFGACVPNIAEPEGNEDERAARAKMIAQSAKILARVTDIHAVARVIEEYCYARDVVLLHAFADFARRAYQKGLHAAAWHLFTEAIPEKAWRTRIDLGEVSLAVSREKELLRIEFIASTHRAFHITFQGLRFDQTGYGFSIRSMSTSSAVAQVLIARAAKNWNPARMGKAEGGDIQENKTGNKRVPITYN